MIILLWNDRSNFDVARKNFGEKFIAEVKEMGGIITISEGDAEVDKAKEIEEKYYRLKPPEFFDVGGLSHLSCSS